MFLLNTDTKFPSKITTNQNHTLNFIEIINKLSKVIGENLRLQKITNLSVQLMHWAKYHGHTTIYKSLKGKEATQELT